MKSFWTALGVMVTVALLSEHSAFAKSYCSDEILSKSDLIIQAEVVDVVKQPSHSFFSFLSHRQLITLKVQKAFQGNVNSGVLVVVETDFIPGAEADTQDFFIKGEQGLAYLKRLPNGNYHTTCRWIYGWKAAPPQK